MFSARKGNLLGLLLLVVLPFIAGCNPNAVADAASGGCGTQMGCCPATGCGTGWLGSSTQLCYNSSSACGSGGNSQCRQCY
jgi:hypothetical protein